MAARAAIDLATDTGAELHVVHVAETSSLPAPGLRPSYPPHRRGSEVRPRPKASSKGNCEEIVGVGATYRKSHLRMGRPAEEILRLSEELVAGLIVVGNQGLSGRFSRMRRFLMGSVSENVTRYARCSVMVVRRDLYERASS